MTPRHLCVIAGTCALVASLAWAGAPVAEPAAEPPASKPVDPPKDEPTNDDADTLPSLDELLGLPTSEVPTETPGDDLPLTDPADRELDRKLSGNEIGEAFQQAVQLMDETADRLGAGRDYGLTTQRLQEDILRKLDQIIASAGQGSGSSSSSSSSEANAPQNQPDQQQQSQSSKGGQSTDTGSPPSSHDGPLNPIAAASEAAWGALPTRVRDALLQGTSDPFSVMYRSMTEAYYRRLAEEGGR